MKSLVLVSMLLAAFAASSAPVTFSLSPVAKSAAITIPKDSIYQISDKFTDHHSHEFKLSERAGKVQLVAMFYSSCQYACPLIIDSALGVEHALKPQARSKLAVLFISLDPARDTPAVLAVLADKRKLDRLRWTLARTAPLSVAKIAALLGVRYRELANGEFNHSSQLILLDTQGRILARTEKMGGVPEPEFLTAVESALAKEVNSERAPASTAN